MFRPFCRPASLSRADGPRRRRRIASHGVVKAAEVEHSWQSLKALEAIAIRPTLVRLFRSI